MAKTTTKDKKKKKTTATASSSAKKRKTPAKAVRKASPKKTATKTSSSAGSKKTTRAKTKSRSTTKAGVAKKATTKSTSTTKRGRKVEVIKSVATKPKKIKGYSKKDLEEFKNVILDKRAEIIEQLQNLKDQMMDTTTGQYVNENSPYSLHMAEQGTDAMEREKTFLYAQRENKFLGYLEDALKRIEAGTYGICVECIDEPQNLCETCPLIPKERLEAVPHSQHCLPIKQRKEKK